MATERTFDSQRWAHDARAQAKGTQIQAERSFGDRAAAGAAAVGQGIQQRAQREDRQQGLQQQDRQFQEQREDRREEFSATMEQRQRETELDVEARTKEQELRRLQAESLINRNNALNQALDWDLEDKRKHRELLGYQSEIEMQDLEIARARNAVMRERYELRKFRQMEQAEMMATASEEDVATWARSMRTQGLFSDLEPGEQGPVTTDASKRARGAVESTKRRQAADSLNALLKSMGEFDSNRFEVAHTAMGLANGDITIEQAQAKIQSLMDTESAQAVGAEPSDPKVIEKAIGEMSDGARQVHLRMQDSPFGSGSRLKIAQWLDNNRRAIGMSFARMANPTRPVDPNDQKAIDRGIDQFLTQIQDPNDPAFNFIASILFGDGGPLGEDDMEALQRGIASRPSDGGWQIPTTNFSANDR